MFLRIFLALGLYYCTDLSAHNITVSDVTLTGRGAAAGTTVIQFDLSWENSWRTDVGPSNWDAAWVFAKYSANGGPWQHAHLSGTGTVPAHGTVRLMGPTGALVYRSANGSGDLVFDELRLAWDFAADGVPKDALLEVKVFAVEMVYVPQGAFYLGDGRGDFGQFRSGGSTTPYRLTTEDALSVTDAAGSLYYDITTNGGDRSGPIPQPFPKGFGAFYCMKYEVSQEQWVDFFNTLPDSYRANHDITAPGRKGSDELVNRNGVSFTGGIATTTRPAVPMNFVSQANGLAYLDWAGLRPMTELEYEKASRGPVYSVAGEYAWGSTDYATSPYTLTDAGTEDERIANLAPERGHHSSRDTDGSIDGPLRCGSFSASAPGYLREEAGGSYYGIMELSGNLWERVVTVGNSSGRSFRATHGDGTLSQQGRANAAHWPGVGSPGYGLRGGAWVSVVERLMVSSRHNATASRNIHEYDVGVFRGVRSL